MSTSKKSRKSSATNKRPDRPFDKAVLDRAGKIVEQYRIVLEPSRELGYIGTAIELPTVLADGRSPDECVVAARDALMVAVATMIEMGKRPPSGQAARNVQINIRLTTEEKLALEGAASRMGFHGISDFVRAAALDRTQRN